LSCRASLVFNYYPDNGSQAHKEEVLRRGRLARGQSATM